MVSERARGERVRLARRLVERYPELSFTHAKQVVAAGQVTVGGEVATDPGLWVAANAEAVWERDRPRRRVRPRLDIVHEDDDVVVVVKPAGLLTQPTPAGERDTLFGRLADALGRGRVRPYLAVVHRLDREASGLLVFARNLGALHALQGQLRAHRLTRRYLAIVEGRLAQEAGTFDRALAGDGTRERRHVAKPGESGRPAVTHFRVRERLAGATLVEVELETGRTHQIRIHFAAAGHPLLGERVYRRPGAPPPPAALARLALHAAELAFIHPRSGERLRSTSPLPGELVQLVDGLRSRG